MTYEPTPEERIAQRDQRRYETFGTFYPSLWQWFLYAVYWVLALEEE